MNIKYRYPIVSNKSRHLVAIEVGLRGCRIETFHPMLPTQKDLMIVVLKIFLSVYNNRLLLKHAADLKLLLFRVFDTGTMRNFKIIFIFNGD